MVLDEKGDYALALVQYNKQPALFKVEPWFKRLMAQSKAFNWINKDEAKKKFVSMFHDAEFGLIVVYQIPDFILLCLI